MANVTLIFKKGSRLLAARPVSLTFIACRVMERIVKGQLTSLPAHQQARLTNMALFSSVHV